MKLFLRILVFVAFLLPLGFVAADVPPGQCVLGDISFSPRENLKPNTPITLTITPGHADCGKNETLFDLNIQESDSNIDDKIYDEMHRFHVNGKPFVMTFNSNGAECESGEECKYFVNLKIKNKKGSRSGGANSYEVENNFYYSSDYDSDVTSFFDTEEKKEKARFEYTCDSSCGKGNNTILDVKTENDQGNENEKCRVENLEINPSGEHIDLGDPFLDQDSQKTIALKFDLKDCGEKPHLRVDVLTLADWNADEEAENARKTGVPPADGKVQILYTPGDEDCDETKNGRIYCNYGFRIYKSTASNPIKQIYIGREGDVGNSKEKIGFYAFKKNKADNIKWSVKSSNLKKITYSSGGEYVPPVKNVDQESPCWRAPGKYPDGTEVTNPKGDYNPNCYEFLAPIPGINKDTQGNHDPNFSKGDDRIAITNIKDYQLGNYINKIFQIAIAILGVLAVVMIVIAGVQYMTVESIYGKGDAKSRITDAALGLILSVSIFLILNTINPRMLDVNFGRGIGEVGVENVPQYDSEQLDYVNSIDTSSVPEPVDGKIFSDPGLLAYIYHQQGSGGASSIMWHAARKKTSLEKQFNVSPKTLARNLKANNASSPSDWLVKFYKKVKVMENKISSIPSNHNSAIDRAAAEHGLDAKPFKAMCLIETRGCAGASTENGYGYKGLFQFQDCKGKGEKSGCVSTWAAYRRSAGSNIYDPYENAWAAMKLYKRNMSFFKKNKIKILGK